MEILLSIFSIALDVTSIVFLIRFLPFLKNVLIPLVKEPSNEMVEQNRLLKEILEVLKTK